MVHYRSFRNSDPPGLTAVWNEAFSGRGQVRLRHSSPLESYLFAKPYFDPAGLIVAVEDDALVGFSHAGFGPNGPQTGLDPSTGVLCALGVRPSHRRRGIGSELLRRGESYLAGKGARAVYAGPLAPLNPFYLGLCGGSETAGFLASDPEVEPFLGRHGYQVRDMALVFQRPLNRPINVADGRFAGLRRRFEVRIAPRTGTGTWWQECVLGPVEVIEFLLEDKQTGQLAARMGVWEMELFSWRWNQPAVGIVDIEVRPELRRQGFAKYLLTQMLRYLQDQFFGLAEVHAGHTNEAVIGLYRSVGFQQVDIGRLYGK